MKRDIIKIKQWHYKFGLVYIQRTSGSVNAHLTPGPAIFCFMFHHMYIAPGRGRQSIGDKILITIERPFLFANMLQVSK